MSSEQPLQFGFTTAGAMKSTLFSRMSPSAKGPAGGPTPSNNLGEAAKIARTQGSTGNIQATTLQSSQVQGMNAPAVRAGNTAVSNNQGSAANRGARSPFRDAM